MQAEDTDRRRRVRMEDLDRLILEFEARQAGWTSPQPEKKLDKKWYVACLSFTILITLGGTSEKKLGKK